RRRHGRAHRAPARAGLRIVRGPAARTRPAALRAAACPGRHGVAADQRDRVSLTTAPGAALSRMRPNAVIIRATVRRCGKKFPEPRMTRWLHAAAAASLVLICPTAGADEGMWTFHGFPFAKANETLKTKLDQAWLDRVRVATVRITGCTGSFVSREGLILTNHHCVESCLA